MNDEQILKLGDHIADKLADDQKFIDAIAKAILDSPFYYGGIQMPDDITNPEYITAEKKRARFNELMKTAEIGDKRKTKWHVFHDNSMDTI